MPVYGALIFGVYIEYLCKMKITYIKSKGFPFSIDKHEVFNKDGYVKIVRKVEPKFESFIVKDFNEISLEEITWFDEVEDDKKMKYIKKALSYLHSYFSLPKRDN